MKYLTKSRFKMALECPTTLFYTKKEDVYASNSLDDPFLQALANGGFQVGELAKCYYPGGIEVEGLDYEKTWSETKKLLEKPDVILYEAAIMFENLFVRVDVLKKIGNKIELIEVKSKSFNSKTFTEDMWQKRNKDKLDAGWMPYIYDIAFQAYVLKEAFPNFEVKSFLMCSDKDHTASVDGLNQKFLIDKKGKQTKVKVIGDVSLKSLGTPILTAVDVSEAIAKIHNDVEASEIYKDKGFKDSIKIFTDAYSKDNKILSEVGKQCKGCDFRTNHATLKSGFNECWKLAHGLTAKELEKPFSFDVWYGPKVPEDKIFMDDIDIGDIAIKVQDPGIDGLTRSQRQWLQVEKHKNKDNSEYIDTDGLKREFARHIYPLHFIDFETSMVAIPFNKGRKSYEQIAFQFSHHVMDTDGSYRHAGEWISTTPGHFPNFDFVRALKKELETDVGTIFRYSNHENTVLNQIRTQLQNSDEKDRNELIAWMETITHKEEKVGGWRGKRDMIDLCKIVIDFYYHPDTHGSNSIKYVLPAVLKAQGKNPNPYGSLPPVFDDYDKETLDRLMSDDDIKNGGAAMTAYALMQFTEMSEAERIKIKEALLRYCKLDTEAMVWIYQYLKGKYE
jgi:hypothetical protein